MTGRDDTSSTATPDVVAIVAGPVDDAVRAHAEDTMRALMLSAPRPVIFSRIKLREDGARPAEQRAIVQGVLDVSGALIRAEATAPTTREAVDLMESRLERRMRRLAERRQEDVQRPPSSPPGEWRHGDLPDSRPGYYRRPVEERRIVRHKTFAPDEISVEEAVLDLDLLDFRFFLFTDEADGVASVVYERDDAGKATIELRRLGGGAPPVDRPLPVDVNPAVPSELTVDEAVAYLNMTDDPFVFYRDAAGGGARVLYRRYDGHYGLVEPR